MRWKTFTIEPYEMRYQLKAVKCQRISILGRGKREGDRKP